MALVALTFVAIITTPDSLLGLPFYRPLTIYPPPWRTVIPSIFTIYHFIAHSEFIIVQFSPRPRLPFYHFNDSAGLSALDILYYFTI